MADYNADHDKEGSKGGSTPRDLALKWEKEIRAAEKEREQFVNSSKETLRRYLDARESQFAENKSVVNLFWSTVQVLLSSLYARPPKVDVSRRFKDQNDDVARVAAVILERILNDNIESDTSTFRTVAQYGIKDRLIVGLGQVWNRYEAEFGPARVDAAVDPQTGEEISPAIEVEVITQEEFPTDYVHWEDFYWSPARVWEEVRWVARRVYMDKQKATERFGEEIACLLPYTKGEKNPTAIDPQAQAWSRAQIFEIWCKDTRKVYWYAKNVDFILDVRDDPLKLKNFFPCPRPLAANLTTSRFIPKSDYSFAQDLYTGIDELKTRIAWLVRACKVAGVYDKNSVEVRNVYQQATELTLIPVDNWAAFAEKGGIKGVVTLMPVEEIANVIAQLRIELAASQQQLFEVLGISDIMRGSSNPNETLGAQQLKAQFGGSRVQFTQSEIADWIAEAQRIKAEIIARHGQPETLLRMSNIQSTPDAGLAQQAIALIKNTDAAQWRITVEGDSMAALDWAQERESRTMFLGAVGGILQQAAPLVQADQRTLPFILEMIKWAMAGFKVGKEIEAVLDQAMQAAQQPQPQQPPLEIEMEKLKHQHAMELQKAKDDTARDIQASKNAVEVWKMGVESQLQQVAQTVQALSDNLAQQRDDVRAQLEAAQKAAPAPAVSVVGGSDVQEIKEVLSALANKKNPRRVRRPIRDENGDIVEVIEEDEPDPAEALAPLAGPRD